MKNPASTVTLERLASTTSMIDVLDHVLDKGIVIDAWIRVSLAGIDLLTVEMRVFVASIDTYLRWGDAIAFTPTVARPGLGDPSRARAVEAGLGHPMPAH